MFRYTRRTAVREVLVVLAALLVFSPLLILLNVSLKTTENSVSTSAFSPADPITLDGFRQALGGEGQNSLLTGAVNSAIITGCSVLVLIALGSITAFTLTRITSGWSRAAFASFLVAIVLPAQLGQVPLYSAMRHLDLLGTRTGMILAYSGMLMPLAVFLYSGFTRSLPLEYEEAAQMEGASRFAIFRRIVFPLLSPATGTVAILAGLIIWNDFFTSLVFLNGSDAVTLPVVVYSFVGTLVSRWNVVFAAVLLSMIPVLVLYLLAQKKFIQGFAGGVKG
ncbi:carbohydrate ABC transporter permease [Kineococcus auxinigenes]|uniref:carbohydrate ABC transporter permease n=1 Tax=unclassified Kineococcus TaxID=2621656 RepID=UPI003D7DF5AE